MRWFFLAVALGMAAGAGKGGVVAMIFFAAMAFGLKESKP